MATVDVTHPTGKEGELWIAWGGHSTVLIELDGVRVLTDPLLPRRVAHLRRVAPAVSDDILRDLDAVLVSHAHYDHLDRRSFARLGPSVRVVVPAGAGRVLRRWGFTRVVEVEAGDEVDLPGLSARVVHADHDGARNPLVRAPAVGYVVTGSAQVYFAGDTDLFPGMAELAGRLDLALLPVAGWGPRLSRGHLDPERAATALTLLHPRVAVPIHWGTYRRVGLSRDAATLRAPAEEFAGFARQLAADVRVQVLPVGGRLEISMASIARTVGGASPAGVRS